MSSLVVPTLYPKKQGLVSLSRQTDQKLVYSSKNAFLACYIKVGGKDKLL